MLKHVDADMWQRAQYFMTSSGWTTLPLLIPLMQAFVILRGYDTDYCNVGTFVLARAVLIALAVGVCGAQMLRVTARTTTAKAKE